MMNSDAHDAAQLTDWIACYNAHGNLTWRTWPLWEFCNITLPKIADVSDQKGKHKQKSNHHQGTSYQVHHLKYWPHEDLFSEVAAASCFGLLHSRGGPSFLLSYLRLSYLELFRGLGWYVGYWDGMISPFIYLSPEMKRHKKQSL